VERNSLYEEVRHVFDDPPPPAAPVRARSLPVVHAA